MKVKTIPEDFIVIEEISLEQGNQNIYLLLKKNYSTHYAIKQIAKSAGIDEKFLRYCGNKDKQAVTLQLFSCDRELSLQMINRRAIQKAPEKFSALKVDNIDYNQFKDTDSFFYVLPMGKGQRLGLGLHKGNDFIIRLRDCKGITEKKFMVNYFDEQRFSKNNIQIGRLILQKNYTEAGKLIDPRIDESHALLELKRLSKRQLQLYLHAFQSYLWNESVSRYFEKQNTKVKKMDIDYGFKKTKLNVPVSETKNFEMPMIGFGYEEDNEIIDQIMQEFSLTPRSFILRDFSNLSLEGGSRNVIVETKVNSQQSGKDTILEFFLPKGCYATMLVKQIA
jgi:tRNA pseudouridine13 synthase